MAKENRKSGDERHPPKNPNTVKYQCGVCGGSGELVTGTGKNAVTRSCGRCNSTGEIGG